jgi:hypothetical protein
MPTDMNTFPADPDLQLAIRARSDLSDYERWQVRSWQAQTFNLSETFASVDWYVFAVRDAQWVSMLEISERIVTVDERPVTVGLIGRVVTVPARRQQAELVEQHAAQLVN